MQFSRAARHAASQLRCGRVFVQPGSLDPGVPSAGKLGLGIIERADEAVELTGPVLDAMEPLKPFIAAGLVDDTDTDLARVDLEMVGGCRRLRGGA